MSRLKVIAAFLWQGVEASQGEVILCGRITAPVCEAAEQLVLTDIAGRCSPKGIQLPFVLCVKSRTAQELRDYGLVGAATVFIR